MSIKHLPDTANRLHKRTVKGTNMTPPPASSLDKAGQEPQGRVASASLTRTAKAAVTYGPEHKPTRQAVETQIRKLKDRIEVENGRVHSLLKRRENDKAISVMRYIVKYHDRLLELAKEAQAIHAKEAEQAKPVAPRKASHKLIVKRKTYKRWSDNPTK